MRVLVGAVSAVLLIAGCTSCGGGASSGGGAGVSASCVAPQLTVTPTTLTPGQPVVVSGDYFAASCNDTSANGEQPPEPEPLRGLTVLLRQGDRTWPLDDEVDASGRLWSIEVHANVPTDAAPGPAEVLVPDHGPPLPVSVAAE